MRQIVLDTETTGLEVSQDHRIIEIGCIELINRRHTGGRYHQYIHPEREIDTGAYEVHGISNEMLADKPVFAKIAEEFLAFVKDAELIIHNAPFDVGFLNHEFSKLGSEFKTIENYCSIIDTLHIARQKHPGQKNNLDALCKRYEVDNSQRDLHGALLDAEILADVYLAMTGGQTNLGLGDHQSNWAGTRDEKINRIAADRQSTPIIKASAYELEAHRKLLEKMSPAKKIRRVW